MLRLGDSGGEQDSTQKAEAKDALDSVSMSAPDRYSEPPSQAVLSCMGGEDSPGAQSKGDALLLNGRLLVLLGAGN